MSLVIMIGLIFYIHIISKNHSVFQTELALLKAKVDSMLPADIQKIDQKVKKMMSADVLEINEEYDEEEEIEEEEEIQEEDDDASVSTTEIKNIIDNIDSEDLKEEEEEEEELAQEIIPEQEIIPQEIIPEQENTIIDGNIIDGELNMLKNVKVDFNSMSLNQLSLQKYDDLKAYLKGIGISSKGTKVEMARKIIEAR
jgi:hypothetical protein